MDFMSFLIPASQVAALLLLTAIPALFLASATDGLLRLLDFCFDEGNIFDWWFSFIQRWETTRPKLFKVLGGCMVCFGFWVSLFLFAGYQFILPLHLSLGVLVLYQGLVMGTLVRRARREQRREQRRKLREQPEELNRGPHYSFTAPAGS